MAILQCLAPLLEYSKKKVGIIYYLTNFADLADIIIRFFLLENVLYYLFFFHFISNISNVLNIEFRLSLHKKQVMRS